MARATVIESPYFSGRHTGERSEGRDWALALLLSYVLTWILEGVARKWLLPGMQQPLYFLRVPIVLAAAAYSLRRLPPMLPAAALAGLFGVVGIFGFCAVHVIMADQTVIQALLGSRLMIELFLMPLALAPWLRPRHALAACRCVVALTIPVAVLAVAQVLSPFGAPINKIFAEDGTDNFTNVGGVVRATGTFTSSAGHASFVILATACAFALSLSPGKRTADYVMLSIAFPVLPIMVLSSGSRSAIFGTGFVVLVSLPLIGLYRPNILPRILFFAGAFAFTAWKIVPLLAPDAWLAMMTRLLGQGMELEAGSRIFDGYTNWVDVLPYAPSFGLGLGSTAQGLGAVGLNYSAVFSEAELQQWVLQFGPALFVVAALLRFAAVFYLVRMTVLAVLRGRLEAAPLVAAGLFVWPTGPIANQGSGNGFAVSAILLVLCYRYSCSGGLDERDPPLRRSAAG